MRAPALRLVAVHRVLILLDCASLVGWWGHNPQTRFSMPPVFDPIPGAGRFAHSNPAVLTTVSLISSLELFQTYPGGVKALRARSEELTGYLEACLTSFDSYVPPDVAEERLQRGPSQTTSEPAFTIITPSLPLSARGSQLSLLFLPSQIGLMQRVFSRLIEFGILGDERQPDVIRLAPTAMYTTFEDCRRAAQGVEVAMREERERWKKEQQKPAQAAAAPTMSKIPSHTKSRKGAGQEQLQRRGSL